MKDRSNEISPTPRITSPEASPILLLSQAALTLSQPNALSDDAGELESVDAFEALGEDEMRSDTTATSSSTPLPVK